MGNAAWLRLVLGAWLCFWHGSLGRASLMDPAAATARTARTARPALATVTGQAAQRVHAALPCDRRCELECTKYGLQGGCKAKMCACYVPSVASLEGGNRRVRRRRSAMRRRYPAHHRPTARTMMARTRKRRRPRSATAATRD